MIATGGPKGRQVQIFVDILLFFFFRRCCHQSVGHFCMEFRHATCSESWQNRPTSSSLRPLSCTSVLCNLRICTVCTKCKDHGPDMEPMSQWLISQLARIGIVPALAIKCRMHIPQ